MPALQPATIYRGIVLQPVWLVLCCASASAALQPLANGPPRTEAQELASKRVVLDFRQALFGDHDPLLAASRYLATDFLNHDPEQPSGAADYADFFLRPVDYGNRTGSPSYTPTPLFALTDGNLTMVAWTAFSSNVFETRNDRITQIWYSGPTSLPMPPSDPGPPAGQSFGRQQIVIPNGIASRADRDDNKRLVQDFIQGFFVKGDDKAARALSATILSHVEGVPSGPGFALVARKHQAKVTAPDVQAPLFVLADGELVDIGFPVPYANDPGARYTQNIIRVQGGKIVEWWFSGTPASMPARIWKMPKLGK